MGLANFWINQWNDQHECDYGIDTSALNNSDANWISTKGQLQDVWQGQWYLKNSNSQPAHLHHRTHRLLVSSSASLCSAKNFFRWLTVPSTPAQQKAICDGWYCLSMLLRGWLNFAFAASASHVYYMLLTWAFAPSLQQRPSYTRGWV